MSDAVETFPLLDPDGSPQATMHLWESSILALDRLLRQHASLMLAAQECKERTDAMIRPLLVEAQGRTIEERRAYAETQLSRDSEFARFNEQAASFRNEAEMAKIDIEIQRMRISLYSSVMALSHGLGAKIGAI